MATLRGTEGLFPHLTKDEVAYVEPMATTGFSVCSLLAQHWGQSSRREQSLLAVVRRRQALLQNRLCGNGDKIKDGRQAFTFFNVNLNGHMSDAFKPFREAPKSSEALWGLLRPWCDIQEAYCYPTSYSVMSAA